MKNIRWCLRSPQRFAGFEHEIRTADVYKLRTSYEVEPRFFDPRSRSGEPDVVLRKGNQTFNVQCKSTDPSASSNMAFETFRYMSGCVARASQGHNVHSHLSVSIRQRLEQPIARRDVDHILVELHKVLEHGLTVSAPWKSKGWEFRFRHRSGTQSPPVTGADLFVMWSGGHQFRDIRSLPGTSPLSDKLTVLCEVAGGQIPSFESYVFPRLEEAARKAPKETPTIICLHLYPAVPVHEYKQNPAVQRVVLPELGRFFDHHRHVCLVLVSSNAQVPFLVRDGKQIIGTPAWEVESRHWEGERPDFDPSAPTG